MLHLSYQRFSAIGDLHLFPSLTSLYLDHNLLTAPALSQLPATLHSLFLHHNQLTSLPLPSLPLLRTLNVSCNALTCLPLLALPSLTALDASHNVLSSLSPLPSSLTSLLLHSNALPPTALDPIAALPDLRVLGLKDNPLVTEVVGYRRVVVGRCAALTFLDDRGVGEEERRGVVGWMRAGREGELEERQKAQQEKRDKAERQWQQWKDSRQRHTALDQRVHYSSLKTQLDGEDATDEGEVAGEEAERRVEPGTPVSVGKEEVAVREGEYHVMKSVSIEAFYSSVQAAIPSVDRTGSDSDDEEGEEAVEEEEAVIPFLLGITPVFNSLSIPSSSSSSSSSTSPPSSALPSVTQSPLTSSPSSGSPRMSPMEGSFDASVISALMGRREEEEKEAEGEGKPGWAGGVQRVMAMISEERGGRVAGVRGREVNVSEEDEEDGGEAEVKWVHIGLDSEDSDEENSSSRM